MHIGKTLHMVLPHPTKSDANNSSEQPFELNVGMF